MHSVSAKMPEGGEPSHPAAPCTQNSSPPVSILVAVWWLCHRGAVSAEEPSCLGTTAASSRVGNGWQKLVFASGFNWFKPAGRNYDGINWQKLAKTQVTKT